jgi:hypothetical protein
MEEFIGKLWNSGANQTYNCRLTGSSLFRAITLVEKYPFAPKEFHHMYP